MNYNTIIEVLDKLIGETEPVADSAIDAERFDNLETLISVTSELLARIGEVSKSDLTMYGSAEKCIVRAQKALKGFAEDIKDELGDKPLAISLSAADDVFLLSADEWEQAKNIPNVPIRACDWWWLRSPGINSTYAACVNYDGGIYDRGYYVGNISGCVCPAFRIFHLSAKGYKPGDKITVENKTVCTVISEDVALADNVICSHRFDPDNNNWETSELKAFINSDEFLAML